MPRPISTAAQSASRSVPHSKLAFNADAAAIAIALLLAALIRFGIIHHIGW